MSEIICYCIDTESVANKGSARLKRNLREEEAEIERGGEQEIKERESVRENEL